MALSAVPSMAEKTLVNLCFPYCMLVKVSCRYIILLSSAFKVIGASGCGDEESVREKTEGTTALLPNFSTIAMRKE